MRVDGAIEELVSRPPRSLADPPDTSDDSSDVSVRWWLDQMNDRGAGGAHMNDCYATIPDGWFGATPADVIAVGTPIPGVFQLG